MSLTKSILLQSDCFIFILHLHFQKEKHIKIKQHLLNAFYLLSTELEICMHYSYLIPVNPGKEDINL